MRKSHHASVTSKRRKWLIALACAAAVIVLSVWLTREAEPHYQGKPLSHWIGAYYDERVTVSSSLSAVSNGEHAAEAIRHIGTNALPLLFEWIRFDSRHETTSMKVEHFIREVRSQLGMDAPRGKSIFEEATDRADAAAYAYCALGDTASPAIPDLIKLMTLETATYRSMRAADALANIGTNALPALVAQLTNTSAPNRIFVAVELGSAGSLRSATNEVVPLLVRTLDDFDDRVAWAAALSLGRMAERDSPTQIFPAVTNLAFVESQSTLRARAIYILGKCGPMAERYVPNLIVALSNESEQVRNSATNALKRLAPEVLTNAPPQ